MGGRIQRCHTRAPVKSNQVGDAEKSLRYEGVGRIGMNLAPAKSLPLQLTALLARASPTSGVLAMIVRLFFVKLSFTELALSLVMNSARRSAAPNHDHEGRPILSKTARRNQAGTRSVFNSSSRPSVISASQVW